MSRIHTIEGMLKLVIWNLSSRCTRPLMLRSVRAGTLSYSAVQLFSKYSNLCENLTTALYVASRGNKRYISAYTLYF